MKIGIMTHWFGKENYGQQLQCWALQQYLLHLGHRPFLIRYEEKPDLKKKLLRKMLHPIAALSALKNRWERKKWPVPQSLLTRHRQFEEFKKNCLAQTKKNYAAPNEMNDEEIAADAYICGSDQVWKFFSNDEYGTPWFLDFAAKGIPRIAYSASFGVSALPPSTLRFITPLLKKMTRIGVREKSGIDICAKAGRSDAVHVLDPVLLLRKEDFEKIAAKESPARKNNPAAEYAFYYFLSFPGEYPWDETKKLSCQRNWNDVFVPCYNRSLFPFPEFCDPSIPEWLTLLKDASAVYTNSFHGTCFSILNEKNFLFFPFSNRMNERIFSLLEMLGLEARIYSPAKGSLASQLDHPIDWAEVRRKLTQFRQKSEAFLNEALHAPVD